MILLLQPLDDTGLQRQRGAAGRSSPCPEGPPLSGHLGAALGMSAWGTAVGQSMPKTPHGNYWSDCRTVLLHRADKCLQSDGPSRRLHHPRAHSGWMALHTNSCGQDACSLKVQHKFAPAPPCSPTHASAPACFYPSLVNHSLGNNP